MSDLKHRSLELFANLEEFSRFIKIKTWMTQSKLTCMQEEMIFEIRMFRKSSRTYVTLVWPRTAVHVHVRFEIARRRERLCTQAAFMWFFLKIRNEINTQNQHRKTYTYILLLLDRWATDPNTIIHGVSRTRGGATALITHGPVQTIINQTVYY